MADSAIITRRSALVGAFSTVFVAPAALSLISDVAAAPMDPWEQARFHAFALRDAMQQFKDPYWIAHVDSAARTSDTIIALYNPHGGRMEQLYRPGDLPGDR